MGTVKRLLERKARADANPFLRYPRPYPPPLRKWPVVTDDGRLVPLATLRARQRKETRAAIAAATAAVTACWSATR